jgi:hypothetical protein
MRVFRFLLIYFFAYLALCSQIVAQTSGNDVLPQPTGAFGVGRVSFYWRDSSRLETLAKDPKARRELMVHLFYPVQPNSNGQPASYFPDVELMRDYEEKNFGKNFMREEYGDSYDSIFTARTHTIIHAQVSGKQRKFPVLVFQPGLGIKVFLYTAIIEELVSHGYVVAAVEPTYDTSVVVLPDGRIIEESDEWNTYVSGNPNDAARFHLERINVNAADNSFVLSQLEKLNTGKLKSPEASFKGRLDIQRAGALGHSQGGLAARRSCQIDKRWKACVNLDGGLRDDEIKIMSNEAIHAPLMLMTGFFTNEKLLATQKAQFRDLRAHGYKVSVKAPGFGHFIYYDLEMPEAKREASRNGLSTVQRRRDTQIIREFTLAFLDKYISGRQESLLDRQSKDYPEVTLEKFGTVTP